MRKLSAKAAAEGITITREVSRVAYARNGNTHNPTIEYRWRVACKGRDVGTTYRYEEARRLAEEFAANPEW